MASSNCLVQATRCVSSSTAFGLSSGSNASYDFNTDAPTNGSSTAPNAASTPARAFIGIFEFLSIAVPISTACES